MARKTLLTEGEIRQFMKLANLSPVAKTRLNEMGALGEQDDELDVALDVEEEPLDDDGMEVDAAELDVEEEPADDMISLEDFVQALEQAVEDVTGQPTDADLEGGEEEDLDMMGGEDDLEVDALEVGVDEDPPGGMDVYEEGGQSAGDQSASRADYMHQHDKDPEEDEEERKKYDRTHKGHGDRKGDQSATRSDFSRSARDRMRSRHRQRPAGTGGYGRQEESLDKDALVAEVAKRVAARLQQETKRDTMVDDLTERIFKRLTQK
jgi:hypothetical protein